MCLVVAAIAAHPRYPLVIAANRDEFHRRASLAAHWWDDGFLAGRDLTAGGAWFGINRPGRWALLTNVREPARHDPAAPSRGAWVPRLLQAHDDPGPALHRLQAAMSQHNGLNLLAGVGARAFWASNRHPGVLALEPGVHGLSNAALDTPWPKLNRTVSALRDWCADPKADLEDAFALLGDRRIARDDELPSTGIPLEWERRLSCPFIVGDDYGTRCSTVLTIDHDRRATFVERSFDSSGRIAGEARHQFPLTDP
jgi:uncharacterized protein with NRDE domain